VAALGLAGPSNRLTRRKLLQLAEPVTSAANALSRNLGYFRSVAAIAGGA
jgi:DNA-binding IclR family transcriptional regulator